jgi:hypothetical protein
MLRLVDMDECSREQRLYASMRSLEKLAYLCLVPGPDYATTKRLADRMGTIIEGNITARIEDEGSL